MADHPIEDPKAYDQQLRQIETSDDVHPDVVNPLFHQLINNDAYLKEQIGELTNLSTEQKSNLVAAINELLDMRGDLNNLDTDDKSRIVAAINELVLKFSTHSSETVSDGAHGMGNIASEEYEEGEWTPSLVGNTNEGNHSYNTTRVGRYIRMGNMVHVMFQVRIYSEDVDTSWEGRLYVSGLPFPARAPWAGNFAHEMEYLNTGSSFISIDASNNDIRFWTHYTDGTNSSDPVDVEDVNTNERIRIRGSVSYEIE
ncbi:hypothetical protein [Salibacterium aidingense]|uniref:hypothetical protein n=1 Tax=Salibacterium aidingense TaxID=384933 RepID=UPI0004197A25|nr:hypothetical protein [Salibacterium aidingense]